jgi:protein-tyrosine phosphatase
VFKVLIVCTGNICRSPVAHAVLAGLVSKSDILRNKVIIDSCGTHNYHVGSMPDYRSIKVARDNGFNIEHLRARVFSDSDLNADLILGMDKGHVALLRSQFPNIENKVFLFREYAENKNSDVEDPYYGNYDGFEKMFAEITNAIQMIIFRLQDELG